MKTENDYLRSIETGVLKNENLFPKVIIKFSHSVRVWTKVWTVNIDLHVASFSLLTESRYSAVISTMLLISYNITYYSFGITKQKFILQILSIYRFTMLQHYSYKHSHKFEIFKIIKQPFCECKQVSCRRNITSVWF